MTCPKSLNKLSLISLQLHYKPKVTSVQTINLFHYKLCDKLFTYFLHYKLKVGFITDPLTYFITNFVTNYLSGFITRLLTYFIYNLCNKLFTNFFICKLLTHFTTNCLLLSSRPPLSQILFPHLVLSILSP